MKLHYAHTSDSILCEMPKLQIAVRIIDRVLRLGDTEEVAFEKAQFTKT